LLVDLLCIDSKQQANDTVSPELINVDVANLLLLLKPWICWFYRRKQKQSMISSPPRFTQVSPNSRQVQFLSPSSRAGIGRITSTSSATQYGWNNLANGGKNSFIICVQLGIQCTVPLMGNWNCHKEPRHIFMLMSAYFWYSYYKLRMFLQSWLTQTYKTHQLWHIEAFDK
jgi:hypothetical protein